VILDFPQRSSPGKISRMSMIRRQPEPPDYFLVIPELKGSWMEWPSGF
jgi:hypothetical protein